MQAETTILVALQKLIDTIARLRDPDRGCPWDLQQTPETLLPYIVEEAYETIDAIQSGDRRAICEELGDLLMQVVLQAQIAGERGDFDLGEVADGIAEKLVRRHPHVFDNLSVESLEEIGYNWEKIKAAEKGENASDRDKLSRKLGKYARSLPPLAGAMKISRKAAAAGFEWPSIEQVWEKFAEELSELKQAIQHESKARQEEELGDLLFAIVQIARWQDLNPETALLGTSKRFVQRLAAIETVAVKPLEDHSLEELEILWKEAKARLARNGEHE